MKLKVDLCHRYMYVCIYVGWLYAVVRYCLL